MNQKKKLMLIVPMLHQGGFERVCVATARLLTPYCEVCIVLFDSHDIAYDIDGLTVIDIHLGVKAGLIGKVVRVLQRSLKVRQLKRQLKTDIAYSFGSTANIVNVLSGKRAKVWVGLRSYMDMEDEGKIRLFLRKADRILCCSKHIEQELQEKYGCDKAVTLYNPLDISDLRKKAAAEAAKLPWKESEKYRIIVSMGREDEVKGFWHLIKAFALVRQKMTDVKLMIVGDGDFRGYQKLARELGVGDDVYFTGMKRNPFPYLQCAQLYVLTSYREGFPNALVEAMALGLPAIATDCPTGPAEILEDQYGILLDNMSPEVNYDASVIIEEEKNLAAQMIELLEDSSQMEHYREMSKKRAGDFTTEKYVERIRQWGGML